MTSPRNRRHILVKSKPTSEPYRPHGKPIEVDKPPAPASRAKHGKALERAMKSAVIQAAQRRAMAGFEVHGARPGLYIQFESRPGDVRNCVNPEHLFLGTPLDNAKDRDLKGRRRSKLSNEDVVSIRLFLNLGAKGRDIAEAFGVSQPTVSYIKNGKTLRW